MIKKNDFLCLAIVLIISTIFYYLTLTGSHGWGGDFSQYIMQAQSLVHGTIPDFMEKNIYLAQHSTSNVGPVTYPWGNAVLYAIGIKLFGDSLLTIRLFNF